MSELALTTISSGNNMHPHPANLWLLCLQERMSEKLMMFFLFELLNHYQVIYFYAVGVDYSILNSTQLVLSGLSVRECIHLAIIDDELPEASESLQVFLSLVSVDVNGSISTSDDVVTFTADQANITIVDSIGKTNTNEERWARKGYKYVAVNCRKNWYRYIIPYC